MRSMALPLENPAVDASVSNLDPSASNENAQGTEENNYVYKDFFEALFKIPDRRIQSRVLRVVGYNVTSYKSQFTQTEDFATPIMNPPRAGTGRKKSRKSMPTEEVPAKRPRRRRQLKYPQENKESPGNVLSASTDSVSPRNEDNSEATMHSFLPPPSPSLSLCPLMNNEDLDLVVGRELECPTDMSDLLDMFALGEDATLEKDVFKDMIKELLVSKVVLETGLL